MYYLLLLILYPISLFPLRVLYVLSDFAFWVLFRLFGYRRKIVLDSLQHAFPEKSHGERRIIMQRFYRSFCDQWVETVKLLSIPLASLDKRVKGNWEVFEQFAAKGKNVYALLGHQFNWEWANVATQMNCSSRFAGIFLPQNARAVDRLLLRIRGRAGGMLIPANDMRPYFSELKSKKHIIGFMADQTPAVLRIADWYSFMNRPAPFFKGPEKQARRAQAAVVFVSIRKVKRGYYSVILHPVCDNAAVMPQGFITGAYVKHLEQELRVQPENWLWTHRRWKRSFSDVTGNEKPE